MKKICEYIILFLVYGIIYEFIEVVYKGGFQYLNLSMFLTGGACGCIIGALNECVFTREMSIVKQVLIGGSIVTVFEFFVGCYVNLYLHMNVWDYTGIPGNILGQICLPFFFAWCGLSFICIFLDDCLRSLLFKKDKPKYHIF